MPAKSTNNLFWDDSDLTVDLKNSKYINKKIFVAQGVALTIAQMCFYFCFMNRTEFASLEINAKNRSKPNYELIITADLQNRSIFVKGTKNRPRYLYKLYKQSDELIQRYASSKTNYLSKKY